MPSPQEKHEMKLMVLTDLCALCKKLSDDAAITDEQRAQARHLVDKFVSLLQFKRKGVPEARVAGQELLTHMAQFLAQVVED
jgi:hypothetical protein